MHRSPFVALSVAAALGLAGCDPGIGASGTVTVDEAVATKWPHKTVRVFLAEKRADGAWQIWDDLGTGPTDARTIEFRSSRIGCTHERPQVIAWIDPYGGLPPEPYSEVRIPAADPFAASKPLPFERGLLRRCYAGHADGVQLTLRAP